MSAARKNLVYFLLFTNPQRSKWYQDDYVEQLALCLHSLARTSDPASFDVAVLADRTKAERVGALPGLGGLSYRIVTFDVPPDLRAAMSARFLVHELLGEEMHRYEKVLYADIDMVFVRDVARLFERVTDPARLYVKPERLAGAGVKDKRYSLLDHTAEEARRFGEERVRAFNSGQLAFVNGPIMARFFADLRDALPELWPRSRFVDQAIINSFARSRHLATPCLEQRALDELVCLEADFEAPRTEETVLVHCVAGDKVTRMRAVLGADAPAAPPPPPPARADAAAAERALAEATARHQKGQLDEAEVLYREGLAHRPEATRERSLLGHLLFKTNRPHEALAVLDQSLALGPSQPDAHTWRGLTLSKLNRRAEAADAYAAALRLHPKHAGAHNNLGMVLLALRRHEEAIPHLQRAVELGHDRPEPFTAMGRAHLGLGRARDAEGAFREALRRSPGFADARAGLADALEELGDGEAAIAELRRAIEAEANPRSFALRSSLAAKLARLAGAEPGEVAAAHEDAGAAYRSTATLGEPAWQVRDRRPERRLRIGLLSPDLRQGPRAAALEALLRAHDPAAVEVACYSITEARDAVTRRLERLAPSWHEVSGRDGYEVAALIAADEIDILMDTAGHRSPLGMSVLALKPAPIQVTWLEHPHGTGLSAVDYRLVDGDAPAGAGTRASEEALPLPAGTVAAAARGDGEALARSIEAAYRTIWRRHCA